MATTTALGTTTDDYFDAAGRAGEAKAADPQGRLKLEG
jgi:hypothetical protein